MCFVCQLDYVACPDSSPLECFFQRCEVAARACGNLFPAPTPSLPSVPISSPPVLFSVSAVLPPPLSPLLSVEPNPSPLNSELRWWWGAQEGEQAAAARRSEPPTPTPPSPRSLSRSLPRHPLTPNPPSLAPAPTNHIITCPLDSPSPPLPPPPTFSLRT